MKAKKGYSGIVGIFSFSSTKFDDALAIAGQENKVQQIVELYATKNDNEARAALRQALTEVSTKMQAGRDEKRSGGQKKEAEYGFSDCQLVAADPDTI